MSIPTPDHQRLIRKLKSIYRLDREDEMALGELPLRHKAVEENADVVREGDAPNECCLLLEGILCRYKIVGDGRRQILSFHIGGDVPDLQSLHLDVMDHSVGALTPCRLAFIPHEAMAALLRERPNLAAAFWRDTLIDAAVFREWLAGVGRRNSHQRVAHLYCEVFSRLEAVGLASNLNFPFPVTQAEIADALGLTPVHVNRVLQDLRRDGLIASDGRSLRILDWGRLTSAGDFDATYLHLRQAA
ncbi:Crp/Fnr family transcriptional regulator [Phenylobacterium sp.]|jgi:CRP-like cAMP-binding protein|uniref:Crp/Fnr family transcriptional regulator n=1 Tax=Phenylobacterium sp. TaxID=1871053 RepID=UPI002E332EC3|nr:Crp/Fnr family transcriptional regulator [Phenylobacterium sp.]HEX2560807.1 Crp/Fnr family transcriptional regulator [Phenylobacterium sp.]